MGHYSFIVRAADGQLLLTSPFYTDKDTAVSRSASTRSLGKRDSNYLVCSTADEQYYFYLRNNKGEILGSSAVYTNRESMEKDLDSLKKCAKGTRLLDLTQPGQAVSSSGKLRSSKADPRSATTSSGIILSQNVTGQYSFAFRATDGQVLLTSPFFTDKETALRRLDLMRNLVLLDQLYLIRNAGVGEFYFELKNNIGEMLGYSPVFSSRESMQKGIDDLKSCARKGKLLDLTGGK